MDKIKNTKTWIKESVGVIFLILALYVCQEHGLVDIIDQNVLKYFIDGCILGAMMLVRKNVKENMGIDIPVPTSTTTPKKEGDK